ncbi:MAG: DUF192 domain-containing protein [Cyanobacteria bacterium P01_D01_bin.73]
MGIDMGNEKPGPSELAQSSSAIACPQYGEITGQATFYPNGGAAEPVVIHLEIAETPAQQSCGLMFRDRLPDNRGMGFPFDPPDEVSFWMRNVPVALDMVFVAHDPSIGESHSGVVGRSYSVLEVITAPPCAESQCPTYGPDGEVAWVIELAEGRATEMGLQKGDRLDIQRLETPLPKAP